MVRTALGRQHSGSDSSTAVSIPQPNDEEKELEDNKDLEKSVPESDNGPENTNDTQAAAVTDWNGPNDPKNPQTWSASKKIYHILVPTILGFVV
jgi:hypothetical protein